MKKTIKSLVISLFLIGSLAYGTKLVQQTQENRSSAAESFEDNRVDIDLPKINQNQIEKIEKIAKENETPSSIVNYKSNKYGYEFSYDSKIWEDNGPTGGRMIDNQDLISIYLKTKNSTKALITFSVGVDADDLDKKTDQSIASSLKYGAQDKRKLLSREKIKIGDYDVNKLVYTENNFIDMKSVINTEEYHLVQNGKSYVFMVNSTEFGETPALINQLLRSFIFFKPTEDNKTGLVKGVSTKTDDIEKTFTEVQLSELVKPSVVGVVQLSCFKLKVDNVNYTSKYLQNSYNFCNGGQGSGFIIQKDGYIATNGHVAKSYPEGAMISSFLYNTGELNSFERDLIREIYFYNMGTEINLFEANKYLVQINSSPTELNDLIKNIYALIDKKIVSFEDIGSKIYIRLGNEAFNFDYNNKDFLSMVKTSDSVFEAELVDFNYSNSDSIEVIKQQKKIDGSDVAILKIKNGNNNMVFPSLVLGSVDNLKEGEQLLVIGFPALVDGSESQQSIINYKSSSYKPTITRGIVSAIKEDNGGRKLIQTDTSIDHGNSGGPALTMDGKVIGVATYGFEGTGGNYNFLRDISDISDLINKNNITISASKSYNDWSLGLSNYWKEYYKSSLPYFNQVKTSYAIHPTVSEFMNDANEAIKEGKDKEVNWLLIGLTIGGVIIVLSGLTIFLIIKKKKIVKNQIEVATSNPLTTPTPTATPTPNQTINSIETINPVVPPVQQTTNSDSNGPIN